MQHTKWNETKWTHIKTIQVIKLHSVFMWCCVFRSYSARAFFSGSSNWARRGSTGDHTRRISDKSEKSKSTKRSIKPKMTEKRKIAITFNNSRNQFPIKGSLTILILKVWIIICTWYNYIKYRLGYINIFLFLLFGYFGLPQSKQQQ